MWYVVLLSFLTWKAQVMLEVIWLIFIKVMVSMTGLKMGWWNKVFRKSNRGKSSVIYSVKKSAVSDIPFPSLKEEEKIAIFCWEYFLLARGVCALPIPEMCILGLKFYKSILWFSIDPKNGFFTLVLKVHFLTFFLSQMLFQGEMRICLWKKRPK